MARTHSRPSSPEPSASLIKRIKISHPTLHVATATNETLAVFASEVLESSNVTRLHKFYLESQPFHYALVGKLFQDDLLKRVKDECLGELSFTEKETDIYKVNQTGDLASLNYLDSSQLSLLPNLLKLRDALYSPEFRAFLQSVTGCGPLSGFKQDMSVNSYTKGCHLLNHDDVIGTRRVSYILYMPLPNYQLWQRDWGGALELYPTKPGPDGLPEPECVPSKSVPPSWNQFIFFEVQPGRSFHSVEEVVVGSGGEDGRERLSISGWFHAAQEREEGYEPPVDEIELKSSREQLVSRITNTQTAFKSYQSSESPTDRPPLPDVELSEEDITFLSEFINPAYLQTRTMQSLASRFVEESSLELHSFLTNSIAEALEPRLKDLDAQDGLGPDRNGKVPPHCSGPPSAWTLKGPPHKWRYCTLLPPSPSAPAVSITPISAHPNPSEILRKLQDELFPSQAFRAWLAIVSRLLPIRHFVEARRFRPGLDYTLATSEEKEARLDVVLGLTPEVKDDESDEHETYLQRGWSAAEWGGWECYMAPHNEEDDPAVYRAGTYKKSDVLGHNTTKVADHDSSGGYEDEEVAIEVDEAEEDSTLLTVQPGFNRLLLVLRDERVMRFVKYVSAAAEGSRWDVCAEYEVGVVQEEGDDE
ncbi:nuclear protein [Lentinula aff. lateritia]|uniref:Nuclear protein n=1 Tax=Lentinula aff. lateritia TaxID=2804960 RepID=A0ACC1U4L5_9AGAR|nr:nuclear protein [Lentinula aff. lateritia]